MPKYKNSISYMGRKANKNHTGQGKFATDAEAIAGVAEDVMISPSTLAASVDDLIPDATTAVKGKVRISTDAEAVTGTDNTVAMTPYTVGLIAIAGSPDASESTKGIAKLSTSAIAVAATDDTTIMTPKKTADVLAAPSAIGGTTPAAATFTDLNADATGDISLDADAASHFAVAGAGIDLTIESAAGRVVVNGEEAADDAVRVLSAAGGLDVDVAKQLSLTSSENTADSIEIVSSAGGIDVTAAGAAGEDIDVTCTSGSVNITAGEDIANAIVINASTGGVDIVADGAAGKDLDMSCTSGSVNITAGENAVDSIVISSTNGGIDITAAGAAAGEDIDITATGSSINITATEADAAAIVINASDAAGGMNISSGSNGMTLDTSGDVEINSSGGYILIGNDNINQPIVIGEQGSRQIEIGNTDGSTQISIKSGEGGLELESAGAGDITADSADKLLLDCADVLELNSSGGAISIGNDGNDFDVNIGTDGERTVTIGNSNANSQIDINSGNGGDVSINAGNRFIVDCADVIEINSDGAAISIGNDDDAFAVNIGTGAAARPVTVGSTNTTSTTTIQSGSGGIVNVGAVTYTPDAITATSAGVAASVATMVTEITTNGDSDLDNVTLAAGIDGQVKIFAVVAVGNAADSVKITPASMIGGTQITFAANPLGLGCQMVYDAGVAGWIVVGNNGGTVS